MLQSSRTHDFFDYAPKHDFEFLAGYSPVSSTWIGRSEDRKLMLAGFMYSYKCWTTGAADISYTVGALPLTFLFQPAQPKLPQASHVRSFRRTLYMAQQSYPLGLQHTLEGMPCNRFAIHGGIIASTEPIPVNAADATGLNFLFDLSPGLRIKISGHQALNMGYKFLHISNAYTTYFNSGVEIMSFSSAFHF